MRKKVIALILVVMALATMFTGCKMFSVDQNRDYHQVIATVTYKDMSADIYKGDVLSYVTNYGGQYLQQGMTIDQVVEYFYATLAKQKLLYLYSKDYIAKNGVDIARVDDDKAISAMENKAFLTVDERRFCIEQTNKQFSDLWKENITALEKEQAANKGEDDKEDDKVDKDKDELAARPSQDKTEPADSTYVKDDTIKDESQLPLLFDAKTKDTIKGEKDDVKKANMKAALDTLNTRLKKNFTDYDYFLEQEYETRIVEKYRSAVGKKVVITDADVDARLIEKQKLNIQSYIDEDAYAAAIGAGTYSYYHTNKGYFEVKSILLKFSQKQTDALKTITTMLGDDEKGKAAVATYREKLALGGDLDANDPIDQLLVASGSGVKVNVSNPKYKADTDKIADAYTDKDIDYRVVLYAMAEDIASQMDIAKAAAIANGITDGSKEMTYILNFAKEKAFVEWIYLVNDDDGMFKGENYKVTRDGRKSDYVTEYTILARQLYKSSGAGALNVKHTDGIGATDAKLAYTVAEGKTPTAVLNVANGKTAKITKEEMSSKDGDDKDLKTNVFTLATEKDNKISYIVNDFGIHVVLVTKVVVDENQSAAIEDVKNDKGEVVGYKLGKDYVYNATVKFTYEKDADGKNIESKIKKVTCEITTIGDFFRQTIKDELQKDMTTADQIDLFKDESLIQKKDSVYKAFLAEIKKNIG
ncbi:MAG: hypothetical protein RSD04_02210 [Clostridia bacterium]